MNLLYSTHFDPLGEDGISRHFAALAEALADRVPIGRAVLLTKRTMAEARQSALIRSGALGEVLVRAGQPTMTAAVLRLLWQRWLHPRALGGEAPATVFLFGYHWLLLIPLLGRQDRLILAGFDCWSGRERRLAQSETGRGRRVLRHLFARVLRWLERRAAARIAGLALVSQNEIDKFCAGLPRRVGARLATRAAVLPPRHFPVARRHDLLTGLRPEVLIWPDGRVRALLEGVGQLLGLIGADPALIDAARYTVLSRASDAALAAASPGAPGFFTNHAFIDDLDGFIAGFDIIIVPDTIGSGIKNRTVQSLASGALVIATGVACEGLSEAVIAAVQPALAPEAIVAQLGAALADRPAARARAMVMGAQIGAFLDHSTSHAAWERICFGEAGPATV